jgi:hypothetical protein
MIRALARDDHYLAAAIESPLNFLPPALAVLEICACGWASALITIALQLGTWLVLPCIPAFRARVDAARVRDAARRAREELFARLGSEHRANFENLVELVDEVSQRLPPADERDVGLRWLLAHYAALACAHNATRQHVSASDRQALLNEVRCLGEATRTTTSRLSGLLEQRRLVAQRRLECLDRTLAELECTATAMATIDSVVRLAHESTVAPITLAGAALDIDDMLAEVSDDRTRTSPPQPSADSIDPLVFETRSVRPVPVSERLRNTQRGEGER